MNRDRFDTDSSGALYLRAPGAPTVREVYSRTFERIETGAELRATIRAGAYAWPGGYPMYFLTDDGATLCFDCARSELRSITQSIRGKHRDGWRVVGTFIHWEGAPETCAHCGADCESAYGDPNAPDSDDAE